MNNNPISLKYLITHFWEMTSRDMWSRVTILDGAIFGLICTAIVLFVIFLIVLIVALFGDR